MADLAAAALVAVAILAACNGGNGDDDPPARGATVDDDKAQAANFRLSDFPPGWEREPAPLNPPDNADDRRFSECMGRPPAVDLRTAIADSDNFSTGDFTRANSSAQVMRTEEIARDDIAALKSEKAIPCLRERLNAELATQSPPGSPPFELRSLDRMDVPADLGDDAVGFRATVTAPPRGAGAVLVIDQVFVKKGNMEVSTSFIEPERPFAADLEETLLRKLVERAGAN